MTAAGTTAETAACDLSAVEAAARIRDGRLTSAALVESCLERIAAREPAVGAWAHLDPAAARAQAAARDAEAPRGPLHGIPVAVKDVIDTADMPTCYGSPIHEGHRPAMDAECVALLREAGAVILGKTVSTEFAAITPNRTANPHDPGHSPGGSSSGSAAAVADRMAPLALGTQTVGSTIRPAAYCGAIGFKPTYDTFGLRGVLPQAPSLDTLGLFARRVADLPPFADALAAADGAFTAGVPAAPPRIGFCPTPHWPSAAPEVVAEMDRATAALAAAGAAVVRIDLSDLYARILDAQWLILKFDIARTLAPEYAAARDRLSDGLRRLIGEGRSVPVADYRAALALTAEGRADIEAVFGRVDVLLTPSAASEAPRGLQSQSDLLFQRLWTALRLPAIALPTATGPGGLPLGIQLVGAAGGDNALLGAAAWCEAILLPDGPVRPGG